MLVTYQFFQQYIDIFFFFFGGGGGGGGKKLLAGEEEIFEEPVKFWNNVPSVHTNLI